MEIKIKKQDLKRLSMYCNNPECGHDVLEHTGAGCTIKTGIHSDGTDVYCPCVEPFEFYKIMDEPAGCSKEYIDAWIDLARKYTTSSGIDNKIPYMFPTDKYTWTVTGIKTKSMDKDKDKEMN